MKDPEDVLGFLLGFLLGGEYEQDEAIIMSTVIGLGLGIAKMRRLQGLPRLEDFIAPPIAVRAAELRGCPRCENDAVVDVEQARIRLTGGGIPVVRCPRCGFPLGDAY